MRVSLYMDDYYTEIPHKKQTALLKTHQNDRKKPCHVFSGAFTAPLHLPLFIDLIIFQSLADFNSPNEYLTHKSSF